MTEEPSEPVGTPLPLPGMPVDDFALAVNAFAQLQNEGAFTLFLGRLNNLRVVGEVPEFIGRLQQTLPSINPAGAAAAMEEIRVTIQVILLFKNADSAASTLAGHFRPNGATNVPAKEAYIEYYRKKVELCRPLVHPSLETRSNRLASALGPVLEDVDMEIVAQRHSPLDKNVVLVPFLRLSIRYSKADHSVWTNLLVNSFSEPRSGDAHFEIECDTTDIDLLIERLFRAKELLSVAITTNEATSTSAKESA